MSAHKSAGYDPRAPKEKDAEEVILYNCDEHGEVKGKIRFSNSHNDTIVECDVCGAFIQIFIAYRTSLPMTSRSFY